jgi:hypothetical protein
MESFLNLVWVAIAICGLGTWRACWIRQNQRRRDPLREWSAVVCTLVFIFFAVSLSDDLQAGRFVLDEGVAGRRHAAVLDSKHPSPESNQNAPQHLLAVVPRSNASPSFSTFSALDCLDHITDVFRPNHAGSNRAPPSFLL